MSTVQEIEKAIRQLPREIIRLRYVIQHRFEDERDRRFADDAESSLLDGFAQTALAEHRTGQSTPLPLYEK